MSSTVSTERAVRIILARMLQLDRTTRASFRENGYRRAGPHSTVFVPNTAVVEATILAGKKVCRQQTTMDLFDTIVGIGHDFRLSAEEIEALLHAILLPDYCPVSW